MHILYIYMLWFSDNLCSIVIVAFFLESIFCMACAATLDHTHITSPLTLLLNVDKECPAECFPPAHCALRVGQLGLTSGLPGKVMEVKSKKCGNECSSLISLCCQVWQTQQCRKKKRISLWVKDVRHPWPGFGQLQPKSLLALLRKRPHAICLQKFKHRFMIHNIHRYIHIIALSWIVSQVLNNENRNNSFSARRCMFCWRRTKRSSVRRRDSSKTASKSLFCKLRKKHWKWY